MLDFIRIGCAVPRVCVADVEKNTQEICKWIEKAEENSCDVLLFPELSMTGYTCGDLFFQQTLLNSVKENLNTVLISGWIKKSCVKKANGKLKQTSFNQFEGR